MRTTPAILAAVLALAATAAPAATILVGPGDSYAKIEAAQAGDEVVLAPGTYAFRVRLTTRAPADRPIVIRAQDPARPPAWDLGSTLVEDAPGSSTAGDRGRGCWQIAGGTNYRLSGIVFTHCRTAGANSAGLRYYAGAKGILVRDCVFRENDNGLTGGTEDSEITVEASEFHRNGNLAASAPTHNLYVYGGTFTLRTSYVHDPVQGQNFHVRARAATLEYNWFARARSYEGDLMTDDDFASGALPPPFAQSMLLRGNVIVQAAAPQNRAQVVAVFDDAGLTGLALDVRLLHNTFVGNGGHAALVHLSNAGGTAMSAELSNNVIAGTTTATLVEDAAHGTVSGLRNWLATGASPGPLVDTVQSAAPGFSNPAASDFTLAPGSAAIGVASTAPAGLPDREYYRDEALARLYRARPSTHDLGAFESTTTGAGIGPYDPQLPPAPAPTTPAGDSTRNRAGGCGTGGAAEGWLAVGAFLLAVSVLGRSRPRRRNAAAVEP